MKRKEYGGKTYEVTGGFCGDCVARNDTETCTALCPREEKAKFGECWREVPAEILEAAQLKADNWSLLQQLQAAEARLDAAAVAMAEAAAGLSVIAAAGCVGRETLRAELRNIGDRLRAARDKAKGIEPA
jgi:hypothetical protein